MEIIEKLLADAPAFHGGGDASYGIHPDVLRFIASETRDGQATLETGSGLSTVVFAAKGCRHTCIAPAPDEFRRIRLYCAERGILTDRVTMIDGRSENVLPALAHEPLDMVLIDGGHGFPIPFVDWLYAGRRLRVGGWMLIDDTQLWTGKVLRDFLRDSPGWKWRTELGLRTAVFQRTADLPIAEEWCNQPHVLRRQRRLDVVHDMRTLAHWVRTGQFAAIGRSIRRRVVKRLDR